MMDPSLMGIPLVLLTWWGAYRAAHWLGGWDGAEWDGGELDRGEEE